MSRIGKKPIDLPDNVKVEVKGGTVKVHGPLGEIQLKYKRNIEVGLDGSKVIVENKNPGNRQARQQHGTIRALIANMVEGVSKGFQKKLEVYGTGYNLKIQGDKLLLNVGFCGSMDVKIPKGIKVDIEVASTKGNEVPAVFTVSGIDKTLVGQFASDVRKIKPPEPYQGKGIRYADEQIKRKVGKAFATGAV